MFLDKVEEQAIRQKLGSLRAEILAKPVAPDLARTERRHPGGNHDDDNVFYDLAQEEHLITNSLAVSRQLTDEQQKMLAQIETALEKLESGSYGYCSNPDCGRRISHKRLMARPFAARCLECQRKYEDKKKRESRHY